MDCLLCEREMRDGQLCPRCARDLGGCLLELPDMFEQMLLPKRAGDASGARVRERTGLDRYLDAIEARTGFDILIAWHGALCADMGGPPPGLPDDPGRRIRAATGALRSNLPWIAKSWPAAGDCAREIQDLHRGAATVVGPSVRDVPMGLCPALHDGVLCGAELRLPHGQQVVRCQWCGATYPPGVWAALRLAQSGMREAS